MDKLEQGIRYLLEYNKIKADIDEYSFDVFRSLMNITMPDKLDSSFYSLQDSIIEEEYKKKSLVSLDEIEKLSRNIYLYKGDITLLKVDAIVNACNSKLLGCFIPLHRCIDNAIHSYAGLQVRRDLMIVMDKQNHDEENGLVKVTSGYNLPAKYIYHTVGPIIYGSETKSDVLDLKNCYLSCLNKAKEMKLHSLAFPCISTGEYHFSNDLAAKVAYKTVSEFLKNNLELDLKVVFVTFKDIDYSLYKEKGKR